MKRNARIGALIRILSDHPSRLYRLGDFCDRFHAARSTISEDLKLAAAILRENDLGRIETIPGAAGGVRFVPRISETRCREIQEELCRRLRDPSRLVGGGFLYTADIMFDPRLTGDMAEIFARRFAGCGADRVVTIETRGVPLALMTARLLNIPLAVVRREVRLSEGPTLSINYFSGSANRLRKMSIARRAVEPGSRALLIDDFMRAGGSLKGISELLAESEVSVCGIGVAIAAVEPETKKVAEFTPLLRLGEVSEEERRIEISPNIQIF
ncbi:MAG: pur operon repressor [Anaerovoracaceae bacterium]|jgi:purine operon repressor